MLRGGDAHDVGRLRRPESRGAIAVLQRRRTNVRVSQQLRRAAHVSSNANADSPVRKCNLSRMQSMTFDNEVAIVTGAGGGLGRCHALELARRGARVVVNDLGSAVDGTGSSATAAELVVSEIVGAGG